MSPPVVPVVSRHVRCDVVVQRRAGSRRESRGAGHGVVRSVPCSRLSNDSPGDLSTMLVLCVLGNVLVR